MAPSSFSTTVYIRARRAQIWQALTQDVHTRIYWYETTQLCDWQQGAAWASICPDGRVANQGEVLSLEAEKRLVLAWRTVFLPELMAEGYSRLCIELEDLGPETLKEPTTKLSLEHDIHLADSKLIKAVSQGWPLVLSSLKSYLGTGQPLDETRTWPKGI